MPVVTMLQRYLRTACATIHATRLHVLVAAVDAVTRGGRLTLTGLGHTLHSRTSIKHTIKRMDRLLGNTHLQCERLLIYAAVTRHVLGAQTRPVIAVDWSDLTTRRWQLLRAALPVGGRAVTLSDEVHSLQKLGNRQVQRMFLRRLQQVLPAGVRPILVTDAGFRSPWFRTVEELGWTFVGRVRNRDLVRVEPTSLWIACKSLYARARTTPKTVGACDLVRSQPFRCRLVVVKEPRKHRIHTSVWGQKVRSAHSRKQAAGHREPWLLATSLALADYQAPQIVAFYRTRMQIEEAFRDMKAERYGFGLNGSHTTQQARWTILLLIAALAHMALWLLGLATIQARHHYQYQANTTRHRLVLSAITLGRHVIQRGRDRLPAAVLWAALRQSQITLCALTTP
jgi:hypothetical protein